VKRKIFQRIRIMLPYEFGTQLVQVVLPLEGNMWLGALHAHKRLTAIPKAGCISVHQVLSSLSRDAIV
jgi:hypothetical protein